MPAPPADHPPPARAVHVGSEAKGRNEEAAQRSRPSCLLLLTGVATLSSPPALTGSTYIRLLLQTDANSRQ